jgi:enoyl-CoA hydratase/carnithine racemase
MKYEYFEFEIRCGTAWVNLCGAGSPPLSDLCDEFVDLMLRLQEDDAVRVVLITEEDNSFDLRPDLESIAQDKCDGKGFESLAPDLEVARKLVTIIQEMAKPVIAAVRGDVRESGFGFFLAADIRLASTTASFTAPDMSRGLLPDWGLSSTLPRLIGPGRTLDLIWTRRTISASEASRIGLVDRLIDDEAWYDELAAYTSRLCNLPQPAVRLAKLAAQQASQFDLTAMLSYEYEAQHQCWDADETTEGMAAFLSGRSPHFPPKPTEETD